MTLLMMPEHKETNRSTLKLTTTTHCNRGSAGELVELHVMFLIYKPLLIKASAK